VRAVLRRQEIGRAASQRDPEGAGTDSMAGTSNDALAVSPTPTGNRSY
jgi:hypothetical protein